MTGASTGQWFQFSTISIVKFAFDTIESYLISQTSCHVRDGASIANVKPPKAYRLLGRDVLKLYKYNFRQIYARVKKLY